MILSGALEPLAIPQLLGGRIHVPGTCCNLLPPLTLAVRVPGSVLCKFKAGLQRMLQALSSIS